MKLKLLFPFLLFCGMASAQIANIPDGPFKTALLNPTTGSDISVTLYSGDGEIVDVNNDGQLQVSEALNVKYLDIYGIPNLQGVQALANLAWLNVFNNLSSLDISGMTSLTNVSVAGISGALNLSGCSSLTSLSFQNVGTLNCTNATSLVEYLAFGSTITTANFTGCTSLKKLDLSLSDVQSVNVTGCTNLENLFLTANKIVSIDVSSCVNLKWLDLQHNPDLASVNLDNHVNLVDLSISMAHITTLDLSGCPALQSLELQSQNLTSLDLSQNSFLNKLDLTTDSLTNLNLKNGFVQYTYFSVFASHSQPVRVCIDEGEETFAEQIMAGLNFVYSTYCTFQPGGNYNGITGNLKLDLDTNGCDAGDLPMKFVKMKRNNGTADSYTFSNDIGKYNFYVPAGNFTVSPVFEDNWYTATPVSATVNFADNNNNNTIRDFCVVANGVHPDVEVVVMPIGIANPGFDSDYKIVYRNKGNQTISGNITFTYDDGVLDFVSALPSTSSSAAGSLTWNYTNLLPFEDRAIAVKLNLNGPMETPPANNGDVLNFSVTAPVTADESPANNTFALAQTVTGSYDPNDILCLEGAVLPPSSIGSYLHYVVNFENTGTASATFVVVKLTINPADFDVNTLQMMNSTHPVYVRMNGNVVEFIFDAINLYAGDHGNILFKLKSKNNLVAGDNVVNNANIYFDYNWPVQTNDANTVFQILSRGHFEKDDSVHVYPNPVKNTISIKADTTVQSAQLYDVQGRLLESVSGIVESMDISARAAGIYFLKVKTEKGIKTEKIVKQ